MKNILHLLIICCCYLPFSLFAQQGFIKSFPGSGTERAQNLVQSTDGNYAFITHTTLGLNSSGLGIGNHLVKVDEDGNTIWEVNYLANNDYPQSTLVSTPDNGFLINTRKNFTGNMHQPYLIKLDAAGNIEWEQFYLWAGGSFTESLAAAVLSDGNYLFTGSGGGSAVFTRKLTPNLDEIWTTEMFYGSRLPTELSNGNIFLQNSSSSAGKARMLDAQGNILWEIPNSDLGVEIASAIGTDDGGIILTSTYTPWFVQNIRKQLKVNSAGTILWDKAIDLGGIENVFTKPIKLADGILMSGTIDNQLPDGGEAILLLKTDFDGNVLWQKQVNIVQSSASEFSPNIVLTADGGIMGVASIDNADYQTFLFKTDLEGNLYTSELNGTVAREEIENCEVDASEITLENWILSATKGNQEFFTVTDAAGNYALSVDTGDYVLSVYPPNNSWNPCANDIPVNVTPGLTQTTDFPIEVLWNCPILNISGHLPFARPCFDNNRYYVNYCNEGTAIAEDAEVFIVTDPQLSFVSASITPITQSANEYTFVLGDIPSGDCGSFHIDFMLDCDAELDASVCIEATITPILECIPTDPNWDGAYVEVVIDCENDEVKFTLENTGTNDMSGVSQYVVIEDAILMRQDNFQLLAGQQMSFSILANGSTQTLIADQVIFAPGDPHPTAWVEGCGVNGSGGISTGYVNQFSLGDNAPYRDVDCTIITRAYDPNDKQGFPIGYQAEHFIEPNTPIDYRLRFQNTGNDTAFTVVLTDRIAPELDLRSLRPGSASHSYTWRIVDGNKLEFTFDNILLPDSTTNLAGSNGFVEFKIDQKIDLPIGTIINNQAAIFFDFNEPIITNETYHQVGINFITVSTQDPISQKTRLSISPNPFQEFALIEFSEMEFNAGQLELFNSSGQQIAMHKFTGSQLKLTRSGLIAGMYFFRISEKGMVVNSGKIMVKD